MAKECAESARVPISYGSFINQFPPYIIQSMQQMRRTYTKMCRQKMSLLFNEIGINEEMLPKYTHTHTHIYIYRERERTGT